MEPILLNVPNEITTERLLVRMPRAGDGPLVFAAVQDSVAELRPWMPWVHPEAKLESVEMWCRRAESKFASREGFNFSLYLRGTETCIGNCSIDRVNWAVPAGEIGYWLRTPYCGKGFMTEAVNAVYDFAAEHAKLKRVEIRCDTRNARSAKTAERCGFELEGVLKKDALDPYGHLRDTRIYAKFPS